MKSFSQDCKIFQINSPAVKPIPFPTIKATLQLTPKMINRLKFCKPVIPLAIQILSYSDVYFDETSKLSGYLTLSFVHTSIKSFSRPSSQATSSVWSINSLPLPHMEHKLYRMVSNLSYDGFIWGIC